jgi:hypothetical protein
MNAELLATLAGAAAGWLTADAINKTPGVRVLDVVVLGPFLILASFEPAPTKAQRWALAFAGGATVTYNLKNYLGNLKRGDV